MPITLTPEDGRGATLTLGTSTWETNTAITGITFAGMTRNTLETTHLGTNTARTYIIEDLYDAGELTVEFLHQDITAPPVITATNTTADTITVTYPLSTGATNAATVAASGYCTEFVPGALAVGELSKGSAKFKLTGAITFTSAT